MVALPEADDPTPSHTSPFPTTSNYSLRIPPLLSRSSSTSSHRTENGPKLLLLTHISEPELQPKPKLKPTFPSRQSMINPSIHSSIHRPSIGQFIVHPFVPSLLPKFHSTLTSTSTQTPPTHLLTHPTKQQAKPHLNLRCAASSAARARLSQPHRDPLCCTVNNNHPQPTNHSIVQYVRPRLHFSLVVSLFLLLLRLLLFLRLMRSSPPPFLFAVSRRTKME